MPFCQVIVDINHTDVDHVFTYRVPAGLDVCPGMRVHVPFGPRKLEGVVVEMAADCDLPPERVKDICDTLEDLLLDEQDCPDYTPYIIERDGLYYRRRKSSGRRFARWRWR